MKTFKFQVGDEVLGIEHPKYGNKPFDGVGKITTVCESKGNKQWYWVEIKESTGTTNAMISEDELLNVKDTPLPSGLSKDKPVEGKTYALTGGPNEKCILNGNSWKESEVKS